MMNQTLIHFWLTVINCVIKDMFTNSDTMDIHMNNFKLCLKDTLIITDKLYQYGMLLYCTNYRHSRTLKTAPVQNIDAAQLQIFQNTENCSSAKNINYRYARTLKTVTVQKYWQIVYLQIFWNTEHCTSIEDW